MLFLDTFILSLILTYTFFVTSVPDNNSLDRCPHTVHIYRITGTGAFETGSLTVLAETEKVVIGIETVVTRTKTVVTRTKTVVTRTEAVVSKQLKQEKALVQ